METNPQFALYFVLLARPNSCLAFLVKLLSEGFPFLLSSILLFLLENGVEADLETIGIWSFDLG